MANVYPAGSLVRQSEVFTSLATGLPADPATVKLQWEVVGPSGSPGAITTWTYGGAGSIVQDSTGKYHADLDTTALPGQWQGEWLAPPGSGQAMSPWIFIVLPTNVR